MRTLALLVLSLTGVIALLDVAASFVFNGSVNVPPLVVLAVASAWVAHLVEGKAQRKVDSGDVVTLLRLRLHAAALARHTQVLDKLQRG